MDKELHPNKTSECNTYPNFNDGLIKTPLNRDIEQ